MQALGKAQNDVLVTDSEMAVERAIKCFLRASSSRFGRFNLRIDQLIGLLSFLPDVAMRFFLLENSYLASFFSLRRVYCAVAKSAGWASQSGGANHNSRGGAMIARL